MSIRSELNNAKYYLRESRKAILGRGGEISEKAGLKDIPEAVWSIPADASLAFREDSEVSYEKVVPVGAEEYALVKSLGGMSYKLESNNLCFADGRYECSGMSTEIPLGDYSHLEDGQYYLSIDVSELKGYYGFKMTYTDGVFESDTILSPQTSLNFNFNIDTNDGNCSLIILGETMYSAPDEPASDLSGFVKNIMLCKADDEDKTYKPYSPILVSAKPTSLESRGANLFDIYRTDFVGASNYALRLKPKAENGILYSGGQRGEVEGAGVPIYLKPNTDYTFSCDIKTNDANPTLVLRLISNIDENGIFNQAESPVVLSYTKTGHYSKTFNSGTYKSVVLLAYSETIYGTELTNVQLNYGTTEAPYKPYSAEPIDTKSLPEAVQSLDGWGLGINAEYNNHIEWRNGRVFYIQMLDEFDLSNVGEWKRHGTYSYFYTFPALSPAMQALDFKVFTRSEVPIGLSSKYDMVSINNSIATSLDKVVSYGVTDTKYINVRDSAYTDVATFKEAMNGVKLVYALETPKETDITHLFTDTSPFLKVQGGGSVIAHNERKEAVPSTLKYTIKVGS